MTLESLVGFAGLVSAIGYTLFKMWYEIIRSQTENAFMDVYYKIQQIKDQNQRSELLSDYYQMNFKEFFLNAFYLQDPWKSQSKKIQKLVDESV